MGSLDPVCVLFVCVPVCVFVLQMAITEGTMLQIEALSESINNLTVSANTHKLLVMTDSPTD